MTDEQKELLKQTFIAANQAALSKKDVEDGGTCNMDTPAFRIKGARKKELEEIARSAGLQIVDFTWFSGQKWYWLMVELNGQGNRRAAMSTAAANVLHQLDDDNLIPFFEACQYCQMD